MLIYPNGWRHSQVVRQRSAKPLSPSSNLGAAFILPVQPQIIKGNLYLLEPIINPIVGMPILPRTKGAMTANFELIEVS